IDAGSWDEVLVLASASGGQSLSRDRATRVAAWISVVPQPLRHPFPDIALDEAAALIVSGELGRAAATLDTIDALPRVTPGGLAVGNLLRASAALRSGALEQAQSEAERAITRLSATPDCLP